MGSEDCFGEESVRERCDLYRVLISFSINLPSLPPPLLLPYPPSSSSSSSSLVIRFIDPLPAISSADLLKFIKQSGRVPWVLDIETGKVNLRCG